LIAEDESVVARYLKDLLEASGFYVVAVAEDATRAMALAQKHNPHAALVDVHLVGSIDGISLAAYLTENCGVNVVFVTGDPMSVCRLASDFKNRVVSKPFSDEQILTTVSAACASHSASVILNEISRDAE